MNQETNKKFFKKTENSSKYFISILASTTLSFKVSYLVLELRVSGYLQSSVLRKNIEISNPGIMKRKKNNILKIKKK